MGDRRRASDGAAPTRTCVRSPVLYLRSFAGELSEYSLRKVFQFGPEDQRLLAGAMSIIGPYIASARPGEPFPELGAAHMKVPAAEWQDVVERMIDLAAAFVVHASPSPGLAWELSRLVAKVTPSKILLIPPRSQKDHDVCCAWMNKILPKPIPAKRPAGTTGIPRRRRSSARSPRASFAVMPLERRRAV